jgi:hypothetical protein
MSTVSICQIQHEAKVINKLADKISCQLDSCHPPICHIEKELCHLDCLLEKLGCNINELCNINVSCLESEVQKAECLDGTLGCELNKPCPCEINWCEVHETNACLQSTTAELVCETNYL